MKSLKILALAVAFALALSVAGVSAEDKVTGNASVGVFNQYIFRGHELSADSIVIQPSATISYKYFSASLWSNIDSKENPTQSFVPDRNGEKSFNETDLTLSYTLEIDKINMTIGYIYYGTKYAAETEELFLTLGYDTLLQPVLSINRDITEYPGTYLNIAVTPSLPLAKDITLDLGASAGYFVGDNSYWKTYTGNNYQGFHDGMIKAGFTIPMANNVSLQPVVQYWFPLSSKAKNTIDGNSYNPNGKLDKTLIGGMSIVVNF